jgi:stearoyl-CoA desaturase (delta-9 desaturase)
MLFDGLLKFSIWGYVWSALLLTHVTIAAVTIFLHRCQAHRGLTLHPAVSHFFRFWLWITTGMVTREWVAVHRKHHAKCEQDEDPHSPQRSGIARVLFGGALLYRREAANKETIDAYGRGTPDDWLERNVYSQFRYSGIGSMLVADLLLFGAVAGFAVWLVQMIWIPFWAAGVINGVGHYWGYRNFETHDASRNIVPWGIIIGGEELHNNHHAYGVSARLSNKWWEFDIGWLYIRLLETLKLAEVRRVAPKTMFADDRPIDKETLKAVVANRFHILKLYGNRVVSPVVRAECQSATGGALRKLQGVRKLIVREGLELDAQLREKLMDALNTNQRVRTIYEFKQRLKSLWNHTVKDSADPLQRLQAWCADAEKSGIAALEQFAQQLRAYRSHLRYA